MDILGKFSKKMYKLEALNELEKRWQAIDQNSPYIKQVDVGTNSRSADDTVSNLSNDGLQYIISKKRTHAKLADMAARSYWRCTKAPAKIVLCYEQLATSTVTVKMTYGKSANNLAITENSLVSAH